VSNRPVPALWRSVPTWYSTDSLGTDHLLGEEGAILSVDAADAGHACYPGVAQIPAKQSWVAVQTRPQTPQLASSVVRFRQVPLQQVSRAAQARPQTPQLASWVLRWRQTPLQQVRSAGQTVPQPPQLASFVRVLMQLPLQKVSPSAQGDGGAAAMQLPFWQIPVVQGVPNRSGWHLPRRQRFLPCFVLRHFPRRQCAHSPHLGLHLPDRAASAWSGSARPSRPRAPPRTAVRTARRDPAAAHERARASKRSASIGESFRGAGTCRKARIGGYP
jgi:hypothetical protein